MSGLVDQLSGLCTELAASLGAGPLADRVDDAASRLRQPLRIAIAGRVKAGKSTLLNAIVGERLAATDASECTRVVTWYRHDLTYGVTAHLTGGTTAAVPFDRGEGRLEIDLSSFDPASVERLDVTWPSARLSEMTLVDTPGLEGRFTAGAARSLELLGFDHTGASQVDAVVYLMRHVHSSDVDFLEAFRDRGLGDTTPVNAIAVLSRVDEVGGGRPDAMESARVIAAHFAADDRVRALCSTVVPVAGLIAETGGSLREEEVSALREIAGLDVPERDRMLLSPDRFVDPAVSSLPSGTRWDLLLRLGMFGARMCVDLLADGSTPTATEVAASLRERSGIVDLIDVLDGHFARRTRLLKARSAILALRSVGRDLAQTQPELAADLDAKLERMEAGSTEMAALRLWHLVLSGEVVVSAEEREEIGLLTAGDSAAECLGVEPTEGALATMVIDRVGRWRERAADPFASPATVELCEIVARRYENLHAELAGAASA